MALHIINEANRCLNCKKPLCQEGCRRAWWKAHPELVDRKAFYLIACTY